MIKIQGTTRSYLTDGSELVDTFEEDYLVLARTKGFTHRQALIKHSLKNTIIPDSLLKVSIQSIVNAKENILIFVGVHC